MLLLLGLGFALTGCDVLASYASSDVGFGAPADAARDGARRDGPGRIDAAIDVEPTVDVRPPDGQAREAGVGVRVISNAVVEAALRAASAPCQGKNESVVNNVGDWGAVRYDTLPPETQKWAGKRPPAADVLVLVYSPEGCEALGPNDPNCSNTGADSSWGSAGLLIRRGRLLAGNDAELPADLALADINLVDVDHDSSNTIVFKCEFALADDSQLATIFVQHQAGVRVAKQVLVDLASGKLP